MDNATFSALADLNAERMAKLGIPRERHTMDVCMMQMMSYLGELSNLCFRTSNLSEFEHEELEAIVGSLGLSLSTIAQLNNINIGDAALRKASSQMQRVSALNTQNTSPSQQQSPGLGATKVSSQQHSPQSQNVVQPPTIHANPQPAPGDAQFGRGNIRPPAINIHENGVGNNGNANTPTANAMCLSPRTNDGFFPNLDIMLKTRPSPAEIEALQLYFCVPHNGKLVDLIQNGSNTPVTAQNFDRFLELSKPFRPPSATDNDAPPAMRVEQPRNVQPPPAISIPVSNGNAPPAGIPGLMSPSNGTADPFANANPPQAAQPQPQQAATPQRVMYEPPKGGGSKSDAVVEAAVGTPEQPVQTKELRVHAPSAYDAEKVGALFSPNHFEGDLFSPHTTNTNFQVPIYANQAGQSPGAAPGANPNLIAQVGPGGPAPAATEIPLPEHFSDEAERVFWNKLLQIVRQEAIGPMIGQLQLRFAIPADGKLVPLLPGGENTPVTESNVQQFLSAVEDKKNELDGRLHRSMSIRTLALSNFSKERAVDDLAKFSPTHHQKDLFAPAVGKTQYHVDYDTDATLPPSLRNREQVNTLPTPRHFVEYISKSRQNFEDVYAQVKRNREALHRFNVTWCAVHPTTGQLTELVQGGSAKPVADHDLSDYLDRVDALYRAA